MGIVNVVERYEDKARRIPQIWTQHRDGDKLELKQEEWFPLYFYVRKDSSIPPAAARKIVSVSDETFTGSRGEELIKITCEPVNRREYKQLLNMFPETWEADAEYVTRYLVDKEVPLSDERRICNIDIETYMCLDSEKSPEPVLCMTMHDSWSDEIFVIGWWEGGENKESPRQGPYYIREEYPSHRMGKKTHVFISNSEEIMWKDFADFWESHRPDIVTGWNVEYFDMSYIVNRMLRMEGNGMEPLAQVLSPYGDKPRATRKRGSTLIVPHIKGLDILDLKVAYERLVGGRRSVNKDGIRELTSYSLKYVSEYELGWGKLPPTKRIDKAWDGTFDDLEELILYNIVDVEAALAIDLKSGLTAYYVAQQCKFPYPWNAWNQNSRIIDGQLLRTFKNKTVLPSKPPYIKQTFEAAKVFLPPAGVVNNVGCLDIAAMYINIILSCNISPDTMVPSSWDGPKCCVNETYFRLDKQGILPQAVSYVLEQRQKTRAKAIEARKAGNEEEYKKLWVEQGAWKTLQLSFYGVTSLPSFRLNDKRIARAITWTGEFLIKYTWWLVEQDKWAVPVYGDTDSVYVKLPDDWDAHECREYFEILQDRINIAYDDFMCRPVNLNFVPWTEEEVIDMDFTIGVKEHSMSLKFEKQYKSMLVEGVKKRYAGLKIWEEGVHKDEEIDVTGYETVKSDTHEMFRSAQAELFRLLLNNASQKEVQAFVDKKKQELFDKPGAELSFSKSLSKPLHKYKVRAQHIKAVEYGQEAFSWEFEEGQRIFMVKVKGTPEGYPQHEGVIPIDEDLGVPEDWEPFVDREDIWHTAIGKKLDATLARIGMDVKL